MLDTLKIYSYVNAIRSVYVRIIIFRATCNSPVIRFILSNEADDTKSISNQRQFESPNAKFLVLLNFTSIGETKRSKTISMWKKLEKQFSLVRDDTTPIRARKLYLREERARLIERSSKKKETSSTENNTKS